MTSDSVDGIHTVTENPFFFFCGFLYATTILEVSRKSYIIFQASVSFFQAWCLFYKLSEVVAWRNCLINLIYVLILISFIERDNIKIKQERIKIICYFISPYHFKQKIPLCYNPIN